MNDRQAHLEHFEHRLHRVHQIAPSRGNSSGNKAVDFATFWQIRLPLWLKRVDWVWVGVLAVVIAGGSLICIGLAGLLGYIGYPS